MKRLARRMRAVSSWRAALVVGALAAIVVSVEAGAVLAGPAPGTTAGNTRTLSATKAGKGAGTLTSSPAGISCGPTCQAGYADGTTVTLSAAAATGSEFRGWSGDCSGTGKCVVLMNAFKRITATFAVGPRTLTVHRSGKGTGRITSSPAGINCPATCETSFQYGTSVRLTATPTSNSRFVGWSGNCSGTSTCVLAMKGNRGATATFSATPLGSPKCLVPKVVGLRLKKAKAKIVMANCKVGKITRKPSRLRKKGRVLGQTPKAGRNLTQGAKVNLTVGKGPVAKK